MSWILSLMLTLASAKGLVTRVGGCKTRKEAQSVLIYKQWHLPPTTVTKGFKEKYPQEKNQTSIYITLADKVKSKKVDLVLAEGCEGEIDENFSTTFNGWDYKSLKAESHKRSYQRVLTHVPLKLEARFGAGLKTLCGDSDKLILEGNHRMSNLRGWMGYWIRLTEKTLDEEKRNPFREAAAEQLKMDKSSPVSTLLPEIQKKLREELEGFNRSLAERDDQFVKILQESQFKTAAIVIGGLHVKDLMKKLEAAGFACDLYEPRGYSREDESLIQDFQRALGANPI
ncbi:MAG: hypothetical protein AB7F86_04365 [Bdellovibrionales bacterium]